MTFPMPDLLPALPEIFLVIMVSVVLIVDLFTPEARRDIGYALTLLSLAGAAIITLLTATPDPAYTFNDMFVDDPMADALKLSVYAAVATVLVYSREYVRQRGMLRGEFFALALFATIGMMVMISAGSFLTLYLGLELLTLSLYAMVALRRDDRNAVEAAMKYFVLGALASGMLLYGMSMLYGATGSLDIGEVAAQIGSGEAAGPVLVFGLVFVVAGIGFKLGAVPFHMWVPDVYQGAPTAVTLLIGSAPKLAAFAFVMRMLVQALPALAADWSDMLIILATLSLVLGNVTAIAQTNIKRMLAYSTISHMGFVLLGILSGTTDGYSAAMFYVVTYVLMTLAAFGMIMVLSREGFEAENLEDFRGLNQRNSWHAFVMLLAMFSLAGVPPTVGFYAKLSVLSAVLDAGHLWLAVFAVIFSLIGAFYYLRVVKLMYFDAPLATDEITPNPEVKLLLGVNGLALLAFGILPQPLMAFCSQAIAGSF
jgi:NADH-quinone oxidoreductase subunit N